MRCKKILLIVLVLLFLGIQVVPLMAADKPYTNPRTLVSEEPDSDKGGDGDEYPWQENDGGNDENNDGKPTGEFFLNKGINTITSLFIKIFKGGEKKSNLDSPKEKKSKKNNNWKRFKY